MRTFAVVVLLLSWWSPIRAVSRAREGAADFAMVWISSAHFPLSRSCLWGLGTQQIERAEAGVEGSKPGIVLVLTVDGLILGVQDGVEMRERRIGRKGKI